jgi:hypothetical protein
MKMNEKMKSRIKKLIIKMSQRNNKKMGE